MNGGRRIGGWLTLVNVGQNTTLRDGDVAEQLVQLRIIPRHLQLAIRNDEELNKLLGHVTIAQGGVLPNIHQNLLPKKTAGTKGAATTSQEL
ncbi:histone H2A [Friedmanniomyces endolithicus]|nr:histone H2A [Friedmanniomyces endolithicus]